MQLIFDYDDYQLLDDNTHIVHGSGRLSLDNPQLDREFFHSGSRVLFICDILEYTASIDRIAELSMGVLVVQARILSDIFDPTLIESKKFVLKAR